MSALLESNFSYSYPPVSVNRTKANEQNWISVSPVSGSSYISDSANQIVFKIDNTSSFMRMNSCYLKFTVTAMAGSSPANANTSVITKAGLASIIDSISVKVGNTELPRVEAYPILLSMLYSSFNPTRAQWLNYTEGYTQTNALQSGKRIVTHALQIPFFLSSAYLPLPVIANGVEIRLTLSSSVNVLTAAGATLPSPATKSVTSLSTTRKLSPALHTSKVC